MIEGKMKKAAKFITASVFALTLTALPILTASAAGEGASLDADTVECDMKTGLVTATGNVLMKQGDVKVAGAHAMYNHKTQQGLIEGNVIAVRGDMRMTCAKMTTDGAGHMLATGDVHGTQLDKTFSTQQVDYYPNDNDHVIMASGGILTSANGTFTAAHIEGWLKDEHYVGTGDAHLVSPPRNIEAGGDRFEYYGQADPKAIITGNAWALQDNNTMHSNRMTIYLANNGQAAVQ